MALTIGQREFPIHSLPLSLSLSLSHTRTLPSPTRSLFPSPTSPISLVIEVAGEEEEGEGAAGQSTGTFEVISVAGKTGSVAEDGSFCGGLGGGSPGVWIEEFGKRTLVGKAGTRGDLFAELLREPEEGLMTADPAVEAVEKSNPWPM